MQRVWEAEREERGGRGREDQEGKKWKGLIGLTLFLLAVTLPWTWPSLSQHFGIAPRTTVEFRCNIPGNVEAVVESTGEAYIAPSQFEIGTVPEEVEVKPVPGTPGGDYSISACGTTYNGAVVPGETDRYQVVKTQDGDIAFVKLNQTTRPPLGGE